LNSDIYNVNRLKKAHDPRVWQPKSEQQAVKQPQRKRAKRSGSNDEEEEEIEPKKGDTEPQVVFTTYPKQSSA
jgi:hypothetical protein